MTLSRLSTALIMVGFVVIVAAVSWNSYRTYLLEQETHAVGDAVNPQHGPWGNLYDYLCQNNMMLREMLDAHAVPAPTMIPGVCDQPKGDD